MKSGKEPVISALFLPILFVFTPSCFYPMSFDDAIIKKGVNSKYNAFFLYQDIKGKFREELLGFSFAIDKETFFNNEAKFQVITTGMGGEFQYGFSENIAIGLHGGLSYSLFIKVREYLYGLASLGIHALYTSAFLKFAFYPGKYNAVAFKAGTNLPFLTYFSILYSSIDENKNPKFTISYANIGLSIHSFQFQVNITTRTFFSTGAFISFSKDERTIALYLGGGVNFQGD